jgi:hypothetical protein
MGENDKRNPSEERERKDQPMRPKDLEPQAEQKGPQQVPSSQREGKERR